MENLTQPFDYYVVLDFEATCDQGKSPKPQEIIEFPSVLLSGRTLEMEDDFTSFVRPIHHPVLTDFAFITCGDWDLRRMFPNHCRVCDPRLDFIPHAYRQWINIKKHYIVFRDTKRLPGMAGMLRGLGLELVGRHHSGIDDTRNIARIARHLGNNGISLTITGQGNPPVE